MRGRLHGRERGSRKFGMLAASVGIASILLLVPSLAGAGAAASPGGLRATAIKPVSTITGSKSTSGRLAKTDRSLLGRTSTAKVNVVVKLDYDATASYAGDIKGLAATSPKVTGRKLTGKTPAERAYHAHIGQLDASFRSQLAKSVPSAKAGISLQTVYGGVAVRLPANRVADLLKIKGVSAVQADSLRKLDTVESPTFIGAPTIWNQTGGQTVSGRGVIFGDIDTGIWPEHPMLADNTALGAPPAAPGGPRACDFGDNPTTLATDVFLCNDKVIGGEPFLATYNANVGGEVYPDSARDSNGHGTHTTTTAAGDSVTNAPIFGINRGPVSGVAPGAWVMSYKVCGVQGCFSSDSAAAVQQAVLDGVNVINFSISGGADPYTDPVELAFLDAYHAGVTVAASAGNSGPGAGTAEHDGPWLITVGASTQSREFRSTLTLAADGGAALTLDGTSLTDGITSPTPVVLAQTLPGEDALCQTPLAPGVAAGVIVACQRGVAGRVQKGANVLAGGAAGMILYNLPLADVESDNHFLPTVHLADGTSFLAFVNGHTGVTASFTAGVKADGQGDVMAAFSSRGPEGQFLKPDITAPGVQVLAGNTPTPDEVASGPPGQYYQAIAGTSMSSPHIAGSAILLMALHPSWTPSEIKSALMTTANTNVVKEDLTTPADPFDMGAGRVDLNVAGSAPIVFDENFDDMVNLGPNPMTAPNLNLPSIDVPVMPGSVQVTRTATNVSGHKYKFQVSTTAPAGATIKVSPSKGTIVPGGTQTFTVSITSTAASGQYFGQIQLTGGSTVLHLPVAFFNKQGSVTLAQSCSPTSIVQKQSTLCSLTATNNSSADTAVVVNSTTGNGLKILSATGATVNSKGTAAVTGPVILDHSTDAVPGIAPGASPAGGYLPLELFGIAPVALGDEQNINFNVPSYVFGDHTYTRLGVDSNGYISVGGSNDAADIQFQPQTLPNPAKPNGVIAPYWTDLDGTGAPGMRIGTLTDGTHSWIVVQWNTHIYGDNTPAGQRNLQAWIGYNGTEDISYVYDTPTTLNQGAPVGNGLTIGAENVSGTGGAQIVGVPTTIYALSSTAGSPPGSVTVGLTVRGNKVGTPLLSSTLLSDQVLGSTIVETPITVGPAPLLSSIRRVE
jgi:Subtilase family/Fibronectin type-III domain/PA domain